MAQGRVSGLTVLPHVLLNGHARHCLIEGHREGRPEELTDEMMAAVGRFMCRG
jgi:CsoR family transcriptional regulator, copper-sensing transcriptional repressor